ncbi:MAG TPA: bifunctional (p)ppGpp synthetase/guanosine-3',5'-bis(diphosphate) 3'-pyrophosphohydrolase, partial [Fibrobacter sp.]|nr:bifunctional (p)ppGpp synthetase/guanosine-3',5'-bis(diphosphate) 3'-pyrophosphohydrolase [Fibrobacter sp.]
QIDDIFDIFAIRIIVESIPECYLALGYVHNLWTPLQSRFKDYIATPKPNLYQSIHTTVIGPENKMVEVQIRTKDMDLTAEKGFAAHWAYKLETERSGEELGWLGRMASLQTEILDSTEFLEFLRIDLKPEGMTVFTPKGDSIELPEGASVLDFAFAVHSELGLRCIGAKINDEVVGIDKIVQNGSTIQIIKSPSQEPSPEWLDLVKTVKAKQELRRWMRTSINQQALSLGKEIWERELRLFKIPAIETPSNEDICLYFGASTIDDFFRRLGQGELPLSDLELFIESKTSYTRSKNPYSLKFFLFSKDKKDFSDQMPIQIGHDSNLLINFASCCSPIPGEPIVGVLVPKKGIEVHNTSCKNVEKVPADQLLAVEWNADDTQSFTTYLLITTDNRQGITIDVLNMLAKSNIFLERMSVSSVKYSGRIRLVFKAFRKKQVHSIMQNIEKIPGVREVLKS